MIAYTFTNLHHYYITVGQIIETIIKKYVMKYVTCLMCRSLHTTLVRDNVSRLFFNQCRQCGSSRSVAPIRAGYHAETKADRRAIKNSMK
jgi:translation initiation factor 2 subunit 2